ncbi:hypothetical protein [Streptomyces sp. A1547]|uniref:hypothetical protein n=1 Tax=Streptomyces sp. A1547 TaxID=2563105 RepID=UPI00109E48A6|nr:hypothetical protein [Streptomyces sp. A1547]THA28793.1 hypothetical protein E6W17_40460 [Streptomyces sp. A1547]
MTSSTTSYGYTWADWLYGRDKDAFMAEVYDDCTRIDHCPDEQEKAARIVGLCDKLNGSSRAWVEGVCDFLDFESFRLARGHAPVTHLGDADDFKALAALDAAYRHGAFRGLCRTPGGADWIGVLGELCAAMVHQGFKWLRSADVDAWELPALGEAWCKGVAMWGLVSLPMAVDAAGKDSDNDEALYRIHTVVAAHHMAGAVWKRYRGPHPHRWWDRTVRGTAPAENAIRQFAAWRGWPQELTDLLVRSAQHVNTWKNPQVPPIHLTRLRGLALGPHTPRLHARVNQVVDELVELIGDMTPQEITETRWRCGSWLSTFTAVWRGRGDVIDSEAEVSVFGGMLGVLRESRPHITPEQAERITQWCRARTGHLRPDDQHRIMDEVKDTVAIRGRLPGVPLGSDGAGPRRFVDGVWSTASLSVVHSRHGGRDVPEDMRELTVRLFNTLTSHRRIPGVDVGKDYVDTDCMVCVGDQLFTGLVDNRPSPGVLGATISGALIYCNFGLGAAGDDVDLGTR